MGGVWNCTENNCTAECSVVGDVFVTTFDGRMFLQPGACQYVLAKSRSGSRFTVTLQYTTCAEQQVCIQSVTVVLDEDVSHQITLTREAEVIIGVNPAPALPYIDDMVEVRRLTSVFTQLKVGIGLRLHYDGRGGQVYLQLDSQWRGQTLGLCGTFNGNLRDDFLSPAGMIEGTPQLHANVWKVSSACVAPVNLPIVDPCEMNQHNVFYAAQCEELLGSVFAPCHGYISPNVYQQQCRYQACRCGSSCLCTALAHYAYLCSKHGINLNFRSHVSECGVVCLGGMQYHSCASSCGRSCRALSSTETCHPDDCAEGCGCPDGSFYDDVRQRCVQLSQCHCYSMGGVSQPGEVTFSASGPCQCRNGKMECVPEEKEPDSVEVGDCPEGKVYHSCTEQRGGVACAPTCRNLMLNLTCPPNTPCIPGCVCPPGLVLHHGGCYYPENCPCAWLGLEYLPGETVETPCYKCVCHRGYFNCSYSPCPAVCTVYSDRHYHTFDGLEYDYYSDCQVYLLKAAGHPADLQIMGKQSAGETEVSIVAQNKDCYESGIVCMKILVIHVGLTKIYFTDNSGNPSPSTVVGRGSEFELLKVGYYTVVQFSNQDLTILWDRKTTVHIRAGPQWKGLLSGLCGNFDSVTVNDMTTSSHMEVNNAQTFGDSWALGQCESDHVVERPCEGDLGRQPYAKRECALLYSDVFAPCHNVVDVAWFYRNCLTDTCNCNRGGDSYDCEYYNQELGNGPFSLVSAVYNDTMFGVNRTSSSVFPLVIERLGRLPAPGLLFNFMITAGLQKERTSRVPVVSLESAERPNYFLAVSGRSRLQLEHWSRGEEFSRRATFIQHQGLFLPGHTSFELVGQPGIFLTLTRTSARAQRYDTSEGFKSGSSFTLEESSLVIPYRMMCEWRYQACASPCVHTCSDPDATRCQFLPPVEGCFPRCPKNMVLDEVTRRCVYTEDCVSLPPTPTPFAFVTQSNKTTTPATPSTTTTTTTTTRPTTITTTTPPTTTSTTTTTTTTTATRATTTSSTTVRPMTSTITTTTPSTTSSTERVTTPSAPPPAPPITLTPSSPPETTTLIMTEVTPPQTTATTPMITTARPTTVPTEATTISVTSSPPPPSTIASTTSSPTTISTPALTPPITSTRPPLTSPTTAVTTAPTSTISVLETTTETVTTPQTTPTDSTIITETPTPAETTTVAVTTTVTLPTPVEPTSEQVTTEIVTSPRTSPVTEEGSTIPPFVFPTAPCTPPYSYRIDECAELICFNGELLLHNSSLHCRYNTTQPQCSLLGLPILTNTDPCCPLWQCPYLRVITFDGNNVALYDNGSYILVKLPMETIIGTVEKCPTSQSVNSIRRISSTGGTSGLCFKKLNITTSSHRIIINRLERKVTVNYRPVKLPFSRHSLYVEDTGSMYLIHSPGGVSIQWYHSTGIMVLQYSCCDGNPEDDLKLPNGTVVREVGDMMLFLQGWRVQTTDETEHARRVGDNCTTGDCSTCLSMLRQRAFMPCHNKVPPEQFCDIMWAGDLHYKDHQCDFLAAYVAVCYTHQVCISWRRHNFCPLRCPPGKEYQPCVSTCTSRTCVNRDYYEETTCSFVREECVCRSGTILHRADSPYCVTEDRCVCTDNEGNPRSPGEVWNGSARGCCLYTCVENGSVVAVEPDCNTVLTPLCEREGEYVLDVLEEGACCPKKICECNMTICDSEAPPCDNGNRLVIGYSALSCCPEYRCECDPMACPPVSPPNCREDQFLVEVRGQNSCCYSFLCVCESCIEPIPTCSNGEILAVDLNTTNSCCPHYHCVCDVNLCPESSMSCAPGLSLVQTTLSGLCCPQHHCECQCEDSSLPICQVGEVLVDVPEGNSNCGCPQHICQKAEVCLFQGLTVLSPGQSLVQYFEGELCYTIHCLRHRDPDSGFYAMEITSVNCSQKCGPHQVYAPSSDPQAGSTWVENCTRYDCMETAVGAVTLGSGVVCPPFNDTECIQNGGMVQSYVDGCCRICESPYFFGASGLVLGAVNQRGKEDGKTCKRVAIRTTIRKDDCRSNTPVTVYSCDGKCPSATIFNFNINSHARFCKCCRESGLQTRSVSLYCSRNATLVDMPPHHIPLLQPPHLSSPQEPGSGHVPVVTMESCTYSNKEAKQVALLTCEQHSNPVEVEVEFQSFPFNQDPDSYTVTCRTASNHLVYVKPIDPSACSPGCKTSLLLVEDRRGYNITLSSGRNDTTLEAKTFHLIPVSLASFRVHTTTTSALLTWKLHRQQNLSTLSLYNTHTQSVTHTFNMRPSEVEKSQYVVTGLRPGTRFKVRVVVTTSLGQLNVILKQSLGFGMETAQCPPGWLASGRSCYTVRRRALTWSDALHSCKHLAAGSNLADLKSLDDFTFVSTHLLSHNNLLLLWTGLSDQQEEGRPLWTDGSSYNLTDTMMTLLPANQTDCYALQRNATGPGYFLTPFFCDINLPFICQYQAPQVPSSFSFDLIQVTEHQVELRWSDFSPLSSLDHSSFEIFLQYQKEAHEELGQGEESRRRTLEDKTQKMVKVPISLSSRGVTVAGLSPGSVYSFTLRASHPAGSSWSLGQTQTAYTRPLPPQNITVGFITVSQMSVHWMLPDVQHLAGGTFVVHYQDMSSRHERLVGMSNISCSSETGGLQSCKAVIGGLETHRKYMVEVYAVTQHGIESCGQTPVTGQTAVRAPSGLVVLSSSVNLTVCWTRPHGDPPDAYYITAHPLSSPSASSQWINQSSPGGNCVDLGPFTPGQTYEVGIIAVIGKDRSKKTSITHTTDPLPVPVAVPLSVGSTSAQLYIQHPQLGLIDGVKVCVCLGVCDTVCEGSCGYSCDWYSLPAGVHTVTLRNLSPGAEYQLRVLSTSREQTGPPCYTRPFRTSLVPPSRVREGLVTDSSIELLWDPPRGRALSFEVVCLNCDRPLKVQKVFNQSTVFSSLTPGRLYHFTVRTEKESFTDSSPVTINITAAPSPVELSLVNKTTSSICISWSPGRGEMSALILSIKNITSRQELIISDVALRLYSFTGLAPGSQYTIDVICTSRERKSKPASININTFPEVPQEVALSAHIVTSAFVTWRPPPGQVQEYKLGFGLLSTEETSWIDVLLPGTSYEIRGLIPGSDYGVNIQSVLGSDTSQPVHKEFSTRPAGLCSLYLGYVNSSSVSVSWDSAVGRFDFHRVTVSGTSDTRSLTVPREQQVALVTGLLDGCSYNVSVERVRGVTAGSPAHLTVTTVPARVRGVRVFNVSARAFSLRWEPAVGCVDHYLVSLHPIQGKVTVHPGHDGSSKRGAAVAQGLEWVVHKPDDATFQADVVDVSPGKQFSVTVSAASSSNISPGISRMISTNESVAGPPLSLEGEAVGSNGILLSWTMPSDANNIDEYVIRYKEVCPYPDPTFTQVTKNLEVPETLITDFTSGSTYHIQ
ncbi:unnamed protein product, partial [Pleuronectes platessa]